MIDSFVEFTGWLLGVLLMQPETLLEYQIAALIKSGITIAFITMSFWIFTMFDSRRSGRGK